MKKEQLYEDIFNKLLIIDDEKSKKWWQINKEKTAANFWEWFGVKKEIIRQLADGCYGSVSFPVKSTSVFENLLDSILKKNFNSDDIYF